MAGITIAGALQYKTSLAWGTTGTNGQINFTLPDKHMAIVKLIHPLVVVGTTFKRTTAGPGAWGGIGGFYTDAADRDSGYLAARTQDHVTLMRVGSTLYAKTTSTWATTGATPATLAGSGNGFSTANYQATIAMDGSGVVTATVPAWPALADSAITTDYLGTGYDYYIGSFGYQNTDVYFANIQIFYPGF